MTDISNLTSAGPKPQSMAHNLAANLSKLANGKQQQSLQVGEAAAAGPEMRWKRDFRETINFEHHIVKSLLHIILG